MSAVAVIVIVVVALLLLAMLVAGARRAATAHAHAGGLDPADEAYPYRSHAEASRHAGDDES